MQIATFVVGFIAYAWLLIIVYRQRVWKRLPWFACYVLWECLSTLVLFLLWMFSFRLYFKVYWWSDAIDVLFTVGAVRESFLRIFRGFTDKKGFRWSVWSVIGAVVVYSAWKAVYAPPLQVGRFFTFVAGAEFLFRWCFFGIAGFTAVLSFFTKEPPDTREDAVVFGFGVAAAAYLAYIVSFSFFGTKYIVFTKYLPSFAYFLAVFWWLWVFSRPIRQFGFRELGMGPEDIRKAIRGFRDFGEDLERDHLDPNR